MEILLAILFISYFTTESTQINYCGKAVGAKYIGTNRIVSGYDVGYLKYPWYAALVTKNNVACGGALIGPRTVITAAHCFKEELKLAQQGVVKLEDLYTVKIGVYNICAHENTAREFRVEKVHVHEQYDAKRLYYDITLLTLKNETKNTPLCIPPKAINSRPKDAIVPGLGTLRFQGNMPCTVHEARILIYPDEQCRTMLNKSGGDGAALKNAFCAGYMQGGIDTCQGDSGGPLQILNENGDYVLLGIVSYGFKCALPNELGVYTDASQYLDWIKQKSGLDSNIINQVYKPNTSHVPGHNKPHVPPKKPNKPHKKPIKIVVFHKNKDKSNDHKEH